MRRELRLRLGMELGLGLGLELELGLKGQGVLQQDEQGVHRQRLLEQCL